MIFLLFYLEKFTKQKVIIFAETMKFSTVLILVVIGIFALIQVDNRYIIIKISITNNFIFKKVSDGQLSGGTIESFPSSDIPSIPSTTNTPSLVSTKSTTIDIPSTDIIINANPNLKSIVSSAGWGEHEQLKPAVNSPIISNGDYNFGNRSMVGSPIVNAGQSTNHKSKHEKFGTFSAKPVIYKPAGISVNIVLPGFSNVRKSFQDVYTVEPNPPMHSRKSLQGNVHVPLSYVIGSGIAAQTVGPLNVHIAAST